MLKDEVWLAIAGERDLLCPACCRERFRLHFGRRLAFEDLYPCAFNIYKCSAFEELAPDDVRQWVRMLRELYGIALDEYAKAEAAKYVLARRPAAE